MPRAQSATIRITPNYLFLTGAANRDDRRFADGERFDIHREQYHTSPSGSVPFHCDVTKEADVEALIAQAVTEFGRVDAVLNVAGIGAGALIADVTMEDYDRTFDVDLRGVLFGMKYGIRAMLKTGGGVILNWSSVGGLNASPGSGVYAAAKAGVIAITKAAALECGLKGIRVNAI